MKTKEHLLTLFFCGLCAISLAQPSRETLTALLGKMPVPPALHVDTLEKTRLDKGWRYKIKYLAEDSDTYYHTPKDYIYAYLFVPFEAARHSLPAIIAIHQDGPHDYLGKSEVAGLAGDPEQFYGKELFERGYIVICPDRFYHAQRRRIPNPDTLADLYDDGYMLMLDHWAGQLLCSGRCTIGKEVHDLERSMDVLYATRGVDQSRIGAIGHSAGGNVLAYFMFADPRVKVGASSCGVFEFSSFFNEDAAMKRHACLAIPGFMANATTADYVGMIAPRPFLMTRGTEEWGYDTPQAKQESIDHVKMTKDLEAAARIYYRKKNVSERLKTIYFDENGGFHAFPPKVKETVYAWLDSYLKK
ncbi:MAG TPA: prolyl oligopeptidase family serine peptidase [Mucilaginibacter sp.]|jgi:dienelactone hydrolase|nr:prolyl oligopeptidase family serine peptidase [Mucilaginibacter sp.]